MTTMDPQEHQDRCQRLGIPADYRDKTLDNFTATTTEQLAVIEWARDYVATIATTRANALLCGNVGTGKTHIGCAIVNACADVLGSWWCEWTATWKERARYAQMSRVFAWVKRSYGSQPLLSERDIIVSLTDPRCLVLDEIGIQRGSDFELNLLDEIIDTRYSSGRSTVLISNLSPDQAKKLLGPRIVDRMKHHGCAGFFLKGASQRAAT